MKRELILIILALTLLTACGSPRADTLSAIKAEGVLKVAVLRDAPPHSYLNAELNAYDGTDLKLINEIARSMEAAVEVLPCDSGQLAEAVKAGTVHMALGRILDDECRPEEINFSIAYENGYIYAVTPRGKFTSTLGSLENKTVGGAIELSDTAGIQLNGVSGIIIQPYAEISNVEANLLNKTIDAYICYEQQALALIESENLQAEVLSNAVIERYVIIFAKDDANMAAFINQAITDYEQDGE